MAANPPRGATIYDVAQRAGVSIATVSRVLHGTGRVSAATTQKVQQAAADLRYVPLAAARTLAVNRHDAFGLVMPHLTGPYYAELLVGFEHAAAQRGHSVVVMLAEPREDVRSAVLGLASRVDGLAFVSKSAVPTALIADIAQTRPVVMVARAQVPGADTLVTESRASAARLTSHLLDHGRRDLVFVGDPTPSPDLRARHEGFVQAHAERGLRPAHEPLAVQPREAEGARLAVALVPDLHRIDGAVCGNDELAVALMAGLARQGVRVPDDVAVTGWDDIMTARYISPTLTTVRQPVTDLGRMAADRLADRLEGRLPDPDPTVLPTRLVLRESCGCQL